MSYKCCYCSNILEPQGPIKAMFTSHDVPLRELSIKLNSINLTSAGHFDAAALKALIPKATEDQVLNFATEKISGSEGNFSLHALINLRKDKSVMQHIVICCSNCGKCCDFQKEDKA